MDAPALLLLLLRVLFCVIITTILPKQDLHSTSDPTRTNITNGTIQLQADPRNNGKIYPGKINYGVIDNPPGASGFISFDATINNTDYSVESVCSRSESNAIIVKTGGGQTETETVFHGPIECTSSQGADTTTQQSTSMTGSSQSRDSDGDGIPDSNDRCNHNSDHRCFKES